ncbi:MAG: nuclear transport factor 2 family protein [Rhodoferax sp.]|nr:nuclear transport factor 2 family protein [Rhodoferax sp.]
MPIPAAAPISAAEQVRLAELAFARSMRERNLDQFAECLSQEAVFLSGPKALRGREAVVAGWKAFFVGPDAPFTWEPKTVELLASGTLAHSSGPVFDPEGKHIANFNSIWRFEAPGVWRVVFDKGEDICDCKKS